MEAKRSDDWDHTAALWAAISNSMRTQAPFAQPEEIHPFKTPKRPWELLPKGSLADLGAALVAQGQRQGGGT